MGLELPALSTIIARLPDPKINLAAYGGLVIPLALIIEAPIIMLLAAPTALSKDWGSYRNLAGLTAVDHSHATSVHLVFKVSARPESFLILATTAFWFSLLIPGVNALQSWHQGILLQSEKNSGIPETFGAFLLITILIYLVGMILGRHPGIYVGIFDFSTGMVLQAGWLKYNSKSASAEFSNSHI